MTSNSSLYDAAVAAARRALGPRLRQTGNQNGAPRFNGPCPICGGRDRFRVAQGDTAVLVQCSRGCDFKDLLDALGLTDHDAAARGVPAAAPTPAPASEPEPDPRPAAVWDAGAPPDDTPGTHYLTRDRYVWPHGKALPSAVRWLPRDAARGLGQELRPQLPQQAAGALLYRYGSPGEPTTQAVELEAVGSTGSRVPFAMGNREAKRPAVAGSHFSPSRVFRAVDNPSARGVHVCEGAVDALALVHLEQLGLVRLRGGAVIGVHGAAGFRGQLTSWPGRVTLWPDADPAGQRAVAVFADELEAIGREVTIRRQVPGHDVADWADEAAGERAGFR